MSSDLRNARLASLKTKLEIDQRMLKQVYDGYGVLQDCLDWLSTSKKVKLAKTARDAVAEHVACYAPSMEMDDFQEMPGALQSLLTSLPCPCLPESQMPDGQKTEANRLVVFQLDFSVPNVAR